MNLQKKKNWQWRIIIWSSLFLIFGKELGNWAYHSLGIESAYNATASVATKSGLTQFSANRANTTPVPLAELIIEVRNDTPNDYTIDSKIASGQLKFDGHALSAGEVKRFTILPEVYTEKGMGFGDLLFLSAPMAGSNNATICQEIHTLNYDLKYAGQIRQPLTINLSSIASKMECK